MKDEVLYKDRESQIKAINDTFDFAKTPVSHFLLITSTCNQNNADLYSAT